MLAVVQLRFVPHLIIVGITAVNRFRGNFEHIEKNLHNELKVFFLSLSLQFPGQD